MKKWRRILPKITQFLANHKLGVILTLVFAFALISGVGIVFAQNAPEPSTVSATDETLYTNFLAVLAYVFEVIVWALGNFFTLVIGMLIGVVQYNAFGDSAMVEVGWPIIRDVLNMFVVLAMLGIAIKNLFTPNASPAAAQQQILMLFAGVVLMNFSQLISLLLIDVSQVVTLTFANAVKDIASGNLIELFQAQNLIVTQPATGPSGIDAAVQLLGTSFFRVLLLLAMIIATGAMLIAFVVRIILLWILVTTSPFAFFAWGLKGSFSFANAIFQEWMKQFSALLIFGPVLTFFLWLSLAIVSAGDLATSQGFDVPNVESGFISLSLNTPNLMSTLLATILLFIGLQQAAKLASGAAVVGDIMTRGAEGGAKMVYQKAWQHKGRIAAGTAGLAVGASAGAALAGGVGLATTAGAASGAYAADRLRGDGGAKLTRGAARLATRIGATAEGTSIPLVSEAGAALAGAGSSIATSVSGQFADRAREADKLVAGKDKQWMLSQARNAAKALSGDSVKDKAYRATLTPETIAKDKAVLRSLLADKDLQKELLGQDGGEDVMKAAMAAADSDGFFDHMEDEGKKKSLKDNALKTKARNLHLLDQVKIRETVRDSDFKISMLSEDALMEKNVRDELDQVTETRVDNNGNSWQYSLLDQIEDGKAGVDMKKFAESGYVKLGKDTVKEGKIDLEKLQSFKEVEAAFNRGEINEDALNDTNLWNAHTQDFAKFVRDNVERLDMSKVNQAMRNNLEQYANLQASTATGAAKQQLQRMQYALDEAGGNTTALRDHFNIGAAGNMLDEDRNSMTTLMQRNPMAAASAESTTVTNPNDVTRALVTALKTNRNQIIAQFNKVRRSDDAGMAASFRTALDRYKKALESEVSRPGKNKAVKQNQKDRLMRDITNMESVLI